MQADEPHAPPGYARLLLGPAHPAPALLATTGAAFARPRPPGPPCATGNYPVGLAWSPCGSVVAAGAADGWVRCFRPPTGTPREKAGAVNQRPPADLGRPAAAFFPGEALYDLAFHPVGVGGAGPAAAAGTIPTGQSPAARPPGVGDASRFVGKSGEMILPTGSS